MHKLSIIVRADWDPEARVFVATSDDVPGLVTEAETPEKLLEKLLVMVPELLELNCQGEGQSSDEYREIPLYVMHQQVSKIRVHA